MSNAYSAVMIIVVATTAIVGDRSGSVIRRKTSISVAPSTRAASRISGLMPFSAADRMTIAKPVQIQAPTMMSQIVLPGALMRNAAGWMPTPWSTVGCDTVPAAC